MLGFNMKTQMIKAKMASTGTRLQDMATNQTNFLQPPMTLFSNSRLAECQFSDRFLAGALDKIENGVTELLKSYPGRQKPIIKSGLRGPRYYIEFPLAGKHIDAFSLILGTEKLI